jgi:hypothetical protein
MEVPPPKNLPRARSLRRRHPSGKQRGPDPRQGEESRVLLLSSARHHHSPLHPLVPPPHPPPPPVPLHHRRSHRDDAVSVSTVSNQTQGSDHNSQHDDFSTSNQQGNNNGARFLWFSHLTHRGDGSYRRRTTTTTTTTQASGYATSSSSSSPPPPPFPLTSYVQLLGWGLVAWILYLLLPRGLRKTYCQTDRRRHKRHRQVAILPNQQQHQQDVPVKPSTATAAPSIMKRPVSPPLNISVPRIRAREIHQDLPSKQEQPVQRGGGGRGGGAPPPRNAVANASTRDANASGWTADRARADHRHQDDPELPLLADDFSRDESLVSLLDDSQLSSNATATTTDPSSSASQLNYEPRYHPAIPTPPSVQILRDTFSRLERGGIRLVAHGIHCESKRVWIRITYDRLNVPESFAVKWQTEVCRTIQAADGRVSKVWIKRGGPGHTLPLAKVLCVDVGKNTSALASKPSLDPFTCFSLLTSTGSLDLEARSRLERDAVVCCLSRLLDQVHDADWRQLYRESPEPSTVTTAVVSATSTFPPTSIAETSAAVADPDASLDDLSLL